MNYSERRLRYLESSRRQLRRELDEMGYGQRPQPVVVRQDQSNRPTGFIMAFATAAVLFLSLSISRLIA
jgi:hypothetical protein